MREVPLVVYIGPDKERRVIGEARVFELSDGKGWSVSARIDDTSAFPGYDKFFSNMQYSIGESYPVPEISYSPEPWVFVGDTASFIVPDLKMDQATEQAARYAEQMLWLEDNYGYFSNDYYQVRRAWAEFREQFDGTYLETLVREAFDAIYNPS